jgi:hypothetical protein
MKYTKSTKVIYFILLFLRDLRGKNKTDLFWFWLVRVGITNYKQILYILSILSSFTKKCVLYPLKAQL